MRPGARVVWVVLALSACGAPRPVVTAKTPSTSKPPRPGASASTSAEPEPPPIVLTGPPEHDWHTWSPSSIGGGPFYPVVLLNRPAPSIYGGSCGLSKVEGGLFLGCGTIARVDGARLDTTTIPSPSGAMGLVSGRYPDALFSRVFTGTFSDGYSPPENVFFTSESLWEHWNGKKWAPIHTAGDRFPYVGGSSAFVVMPPASDPKGLANKPGCADASCLRVIPRVITTGAVRPDFAKLKDKIAWIHVHDSQEHQPADFAIAIDETGPVYVVMRALEIGSKKKGFGVAKWTEKEGATFMWLPAPLDVATSGLPTEIVAEKGRLALVFALEKDRYLLEHDGKAWSKKTIKIGDSIKDSPAESDGKYLVSGSGVVELHDKGNKPVKGLEDVSDAGVREYGDDVWILTRDAVYRNQQPPEVLHRMESYGALYPWPPRATKQCPAKFAVFDVTAHATKEVRQMWQFDEALPIVELAVNGLVVVGMPVASLEEGEKLLDKNYPAERRMMEGAPHEIVCARPLPDAKKFVVTP